MTSSSIVPAGAILHREGNGDGLAHLAQQPLHQRQVAQQPGAAVALHHLIDRTAEVDVEDVEAQVLAHAGGIGHDCRIGAEQLRGDRMLLRIEGQVLQGAGGFLAAAGGADAMRAGELGHDQAAAAQSADEAAEDGVGDAGHRRQHGGGSNGYAADVQLAGKTRRPVSLCLA